ncbi:MAG: hypothetical protein Q9201_003631 [Fulgogasparrea decipioides]
MAAPTTYHERTPADPEGDVLLKLYSPEGHSTLRVSAKVLSISSPVFKALFNPEHFKEGQALSSSKPLEVSLPEDDADAMTWLCHALHLRPTLDQEPDFAMCEQVAFLCDKYQCAQALIPWVRVWIPKWRGAPVEPGTKKDHFRILCMAYALDDEVQFWRCCQDIIWLGVDSDFPSEEKLSDPSEIGLAILPEGFVGTYTLALLSNFY